MLPVINKLLSTTTLTTNLSIYSTVIKRIPLLLIRIYRHETVLFRYIYIKRAVPLQAWSGPEGSRKLRFSDFMTTAQDSGKVVSLTHQPPLPPGYTPGTHFC
jgi:hypothetical protein